MKGLQDQEMEEDEEASLEQLRKEREEEAARENQPK